ncbi:MAG TPA: NAD-dependent epimerase/dehydratase family protein [Chitinophagaceae bacterium]|jgi:UDP-glucuronate 4-epimerase|nr:NAD-dependent epimerase/dehydratase family protein [Chitinophagaceae bacterium]
MKKSILVTGGAGFIGSNLVEKILGDDCSVTIVDNFDDFYAREIKKKNLLGIMGDPRVTFIEGDIRDPALYDQQLSDACFDVIVHLAAKAGVRPSIADPLVYQDVNVKGTQLLLEFARKKKITQFVFGSSSSVYGVNKNFPWSEDDHVLQPISPYASTKISGELLGHVYAHLFGIRFLALRFFTVYGPRQRPDLAIHKFASAILTGDPITVFGDGNTKRDYTYIDDIVNGITAAIHYDKTIYEVVNLGNSQMISLSDMIETLQQVLEKKAIVNRLPEQQGDVPVTCASVQKAKMLFGYEPKTSFRDGILKFANWLKAEKQNK